MYRYGLGAAGPSFYFINYEDPKNSRVCKSSSNVDIEGCREKVFLKSYQILQDQICPERSNKEEFLQANVVDPDPGGQKRPTKKKKRK